MNASKTIIINTTHRRFISGHYIKWEYIIFFHWLKSMVNVDLRSKGMLPAVMTSTELIEPILETKI